MKSWSVFVVNLYNKRATKQLRKDVRKNVGQERIPPNDFSSLEMYKWKIDSDVTARNG